jgi:hypothetical protein
MKNSKRKNRRGDTFISKICILGFPKEICPLEAKRRQPWKQIQKELNDAREHLYQVAVNLFQ